jgi:FkbM family methyltransferase
VTLRSVAKALVETALGRDIKRLDGNTIAFIDRRHRHDAWFCYDLQLQSLLNTHQIDLVVDVGANEGQFGRRLRRVYAGDLISFEPVSAPFARLGNIAHADSRWSVHQLALGSTDGTASIHVASDSTFSSFLAVNEFSRQRFRRSVVTADQQVSVKRLDDVLTALPGNTISRRIFLKLDTQGFDLEVFKGLGKYAAQVRMLQSEISLVKIYEGMPDWTESLETYRRDGLYVAGMFPVTRDDKARVIEYDCLLVRDERP